MIHMRWVGVQVKVDGRDYTGIEGETDVRVNNEYQESPSKERTPLGAQVQIEHRAFAWGPVIEEKMNGVEVVAGRVRFIADQARVRPSGEHRSYTQYEVTASGRHLGG